MSCCCWWAMVCFTNTLLMLCSIAYFFAWKRRCSIKIFTKKTKTPHFKLKPKITCTLKAAVIQQLHYYVYWMLWDRLIHCYQILLLNNFTETKLDTSILCIVFLWLPYPLQSLLLLWSERRQAKLGACALSILHLQSFTSLQCRKAK